MEGLGCQWLIRIVWWGSQEKMVPINSKPMILKRDRLKQRQVIAP